MANLPMNFWFDTLNMMTDDQLTPVENASENKHISKCSGTREGHSSFWFNAPGNLQTADSRTSLSQTTINGVEL